MRYFGAIVVALCAILLLVGLGWSGLLHRTPTYDIPADVAQARLQSLDMPMEVTQSVRGWKGMRMVVTEPASGAHRWAISYQGRPFVTMDVTLKPVDALSSQADIVIDKADLETVRTDASVPVRFRKYAPVIQKVQALALEEAAKSTLEGRPFDTMLMAQSLFGDALAITMDNFDEMDRAAAK